MSVCALSLYVRFWHLADMPVAVTNVCFWGAGSTDRRNTF